MEDGKQLSLSVFNDAREKVPRFMAVALKNIEIKPSPLWLQIELMRLGSKAINNIVDVTNYVMLLTAQPTHAYDYDKLRGHKLGARMAKDGERITLLNHKTYELTSDDIVIADGEGPVGLAGIMGGGDSEVDENTKNIVLEVANFDMYTIRKSSMRHGVFTDALTRFNKGQSPLQNDRVLSLLMMSIKDLSPTAEQASDVFDLKDENIKVVQHDKRVILGDGTEKDKSIFTWGSVSGVIVLENTFVNDRLGLKLSPTEVCDLLRNVEIKANEEPEPNTPDQFEVIAPFWRTDIELPEDIVEEVGRLYGFDKLPRELPTRSIKPAMKNKQREMKQHVRERLSRAGANEVLTYSFVHENSMKKAGQNPVHAYRLGNALSPDLQYYRLSLTPSLLDKVHMNVRAGYDAFALFEIGKTHYKGEMDIDEPTVPNEDSHVALVLAYGDKCKPAGSAYYVARKYLEQLGDMRAVSLQSLSDFDLSTDPWGAELTAPYEPKRTAVIVRDGKVWGVVGEFRQVVKTALKLPDYTAGFEIHTALLDDQRQAAYAPLSRYPSVERDVCFQVGPDIPYAAVRQAIDKALENVTLTIKVQPLDFYQPADATYKNLTFRITMTSHEQTLTNDMAHEIVDTVSERVCSDVDATVI